MKLGSIVMTMMKRLAMAAIVAAVAWVAGPRTLAQAAVTPAAKISSAATPKTAASGVPVEVDPCASHPKVCRALHNANKALIDAAQANLKGNYICTSLQLDHGSCGTKTPQPYLTDRSPYGNPADVAEGRQLLDWYLQNVSCETLCKPKQDPQACLQACGQGQDPRKQSSGDTSSPAHAGSSPSP